MCFRCFLWLMLATSAAASTVYGFITPNPEFSGDWIVHLESPTAGYTVDIPLLPAVTYCITPGDGICDLVHSFDYGQTASLLALLGGADPDCICDASGSGVVDGVFYPNLMFDLGPAIDTALALTSAPFAAFFGSYALPVTLSGQIQAAVPPITSTPVNLVINDINDVVSGAGTVFFDLPGQLPPHPLTPVGISFVLTPEPNSVFLLSGVLVLSAGLAWIRRKSIWPSRGPTARTAPRSLS
jgi:hypothetical protein